MQTLLERAKVVRETLQYHDTLNPAIWEGLQMKSDVRDALLRVAKHFIDNLFAKHKEALRGGVLISDIILTGSNANYNWTAYSDLDVHVVIDYLKSDTWPRDRQGKESMLRLLFDSQRTLWNRTHSITVHDYPVELYFQDAAETHISTGVFSLKQNSWILIPTKSPPSVDQKAIEIKWRAFRDLIDDSTIEEDLRATYDKIVQMRKSGLEDAGEFSTENLVFKALRNSGHIQKLIQKLQHLEDQALSEK
jgi:hypothetical protein